MVKTVTIAVSSDASFIASELENCANLINEGSTVLVINSWYYLYIPLCLSLLVGPSGYVVGHGDEGIDFVRKDHSFMLDSHRLILVDYDWELFKKSGFALKAPYDVILIHDKYFSAEIKEQLKSTGVAFDQVNNVLIHKGTRSSSPSSADATNIHLDNDISCSPPSPCDNIKSENNDSRCEKDCLTSHRNGSSNSMMMDT